MKRVNETCRLPPIEKNIVSHVKECRDLISLLDQQKLVTADLLVKGVTVWCIHTTLSVLCTPLSSSYVPACCYCFFNNISRLMQDQGDALMNQIIMHVHRANHQYDSL
jgi:hypothetical protein